MFMHVGYLLCYALWGASGPWRNAQAPEARAKEAKRSSVVVPCTASHCINAVAFFSISFMHLSSAPHGVNRTKLSLLSHCQNGCSAATCAKIQLVMCLPVMCLPITLGRGIQRQSQHKYTQTARCTVFIHTEMVITSSIRRPMRPVPKRKKLLCTCSMPRRPRSLPQMMSFSAYETVSSALRGL